MKILFLVLNSKKLFSCILIQTLGVTSLFAIILLYPLRTQSQYLKPKFKHLGIEDGLTNTFNNFVKKGSRGFVWISSINGLNRFDGKFIKPFHFPKGNNIQSSFFEDANGNLWFGTDLDIKVINRKTNKPDSYKFFFDADSVKGPYFIFHVEKDRNVLWVKAGDAIFNFNTLSREYKKLPINTSGIRFAVASEPNGGVKQFYACPWMRGYGIEEWTKDSSGSWVSRTLLKSGLLEYQIPPPQVSQVIIQSDTSLWLFSDQGLIRVNPKKINTSLPYYPKELRGINCHNGLIYTDNLMLISTHNQGIWVLDMETGRFSQQIKHDAEDHASLSNDSPFELYLDHQNHLWVTHPRQGLDYTENNVSSGIVSNPFAKVSSSEVKVISIIEDFDNQIWVATEKKGVFTFDIEGKSLREYPYQALSNPDFFEVRNLSLDSEGNVWAITPEALFVFNQKWGEWDKVYENQGFRLYFLYHLQSGKSILTTNGGLMELKSMSESYFVEPLKGFQDIAPRSVRIFELSQQRYLFIPFSSHKIELYQGDAEGNMQLMLQFDKKVSIFGIYESERNGKIWVGTSKGPAYLDLQSGDFFYFLEEKWTKEKGAAYGVIEDEEGRIWISSDHGIWMYNIQEKQLIQLRKENGLSSESFSYYAYLKDHTNQLWFGGNNGISIIRPDSFYLSPHPPIAYMDELLINNVSYNGPNSIGEEDNLKLSYQENSLSLRVLANGYYLAKYNKVRFRLVNYDNKWKEVSHGGYSSFTKIPPGEYIFEYLAINANGIESPIKKLKIKISPPFWQTWWFRIGTIGLICIVLFALIRSYVSQKLQEQRIIFERRQALQEERNRIGSELHDDLGSTLSKIRYLIQDVLYQKIDESSREKLTRVSFWAVDLLDQTSDIVWALSAENDSLESLIIQIRAHASEYLSLNKLNYVLNLPDDIPDLELNGERRRNILLIVKESLRNAVRHAEAKEMLLGITLENHKLHIYIRDNGKGIGTNLKNKRGNGLRNMYDRANAIQGKLSFESAEGRGTLISLVVPLKSIISQKS